MAETKKKDNKKLVGIICGVIVLLAVVALVLNVISGSKKNDNKKGNNPTEEKKIVATEKTIEKEYGFSKEDAIAKIKEIYKSDVYEFSAKSREDNKYIVTVTNLITKEKTNYIVNPMDGSWERESE